eukprot:CAMPEP_0201514496 /NCGR_PEP_ID=MMETSP0161_2-20130828/6330_1 /ASSEMBLY_ACC=CAM_ASM_000251 /TAXON_ID=180227 /ORGANISM="Neoparamoeba aestuarina, Strain SoJaBio B1-5/56/2" /LENGTH=153 /DNA_ID=CAMNT_0047911071 /DNA_START=120 /DNA_END=577 /DNA_ORIENTATION=-
MFWNKKKKKTDDAFAISGPQSNTFKTVSSIKYDSDKGSWNTVGLPSEWMTMLGSSGFTEQEVEEEKETLMAVMKFQERMGQGAGAALPEEEHEEYEEPPQSPPSPTPLNRSMGGAPPSSPLRSSSRANAAPPPPPPGGASNSSSLPSLPPPPP